MMKSFNTRLLRLVGGCFLARCALGACSADAEQPRIDSVWINMVSRPVEEVTCAYPGQTLCLRGEHLGDLSRVIVNGTDINLNTLFVYQSDAAITFSLPSDVNTEGDYIRVVTRWGMAEIPFVVRPKSEKPQITAFSATTLVPGRTLTITGANLQGAVEVWLPLAFDERICCEPDGVQDDGGGSIQIVIPDEVTFASGRCEVVMEKMDPQRGLRYTEKVFSDKTDFVN